jgi:hypothetical protein
MFTKINEDWVWETTISELEDLIKTFCRPPYDKAFSIKIILPQGAQIDLEEGKSITLKNPESDFEVAY